MDHKALSALILRIAGVLVLVYTVTNATKNFTPFLNPYTTQDAGLWSMGLAILVSAVLPILIGLALIYFPSTIATSVLKVPGGEVKADDIEPLQRVAFSTLGLWLALYAIIDAVYFWGKARLYLLYMEDMPASYAKPPMLADDFGGLISCAVQFIIGICLLIGNRGIVNAIARLRR